jgi:leucyl aminopeptidase
VAPPSVRLVTGPLADTDAPAVAAATSRSGPSGPPTASPDVVELATSLGLDVTVALQRASADGGAGEVVDLPVTRPGTTVRRLLLVGLGDGSPDDARTAGAALARRLAGVERVAAATAAGLDADALRAHLEGLLLAAYEFRADGARRDPAKAPVGSVDLHLPRDRRGLVATAVDHATVAAAATHLARDLANTPSSVKDPAWLAAQALRSARGAGVDVTVRDERALAREGFGGLVAVGAGSSRPPRLIEARYEPAGRARRRLQHVVLVGKGITFDSGGLSLKPREAMVPMKTDMAAGGAVLAVMAALRDLGVRARVTGLVAAAENLPGAGAMRPGDVITQYGGRTTEVFNTDAEGRLVLGDALAYADAELDPDLLVDVATLTGAAASGLGRRHGALFTADEELATGLLAAGERSGERLWRMPLVEDYRRALDSQIADLANVSRDPSVSGGAITAALFLREFVGDRRWAHLDIAGPARSDKDEREVCRGGTGFGARLLLRWLEEL